MPLTWSQESPFVQRDMYVNHIVIAYSLSHSCTVIHGTRASLPKSYQMKQSMKVSSCFQIAFHGWWSGKDSCYATICKEKHRETVKDPPSKIEVFLHFFQLTLLNYVGAQDKNEVKQKHPPQEQRTQKSMTCLRGNPALPPSCSCRWQIASIF